MATGSNKGVTNTPLLVVPSLGSFFVLLLSLFAAVAKGTLVGVVTELLLAANNMDDDDDRCKDPEDLSFIFCFLSVFSMVVAIVNKGL